MAKTSLVVQWLSFQASNLGVMGLNPGGSTWLLPLPSKSSPARPSLLAGCSAQMSPPPKEKVFLNSRAKLRSRRSHSTAPPKREGNGFTASPPLSDPLSPQSLTLQDAEEHQRQLRKKQKNRAAAQRSRQKHTNKADALHQVGVPPFPSLASLTWPGHLFSAPPISSSPCIAVGARGPEPGERGGLCS